jgi:hypothetical protein
MFRYDYRFETGGWSIYDKAFIVIIIRRVKWANTKYLVNRRNGHIIITSVLSE